MTTEKILRELRAVEKTATKQVFTFEVRVADMAKDAADAIEELMAFTNQITAMNSCNDCFNIDCDHMPRLGESVRYNCFLYQPAPCSGKELFCREIVQDIPLTDVEFETALEKACGAEIARFQFQRYEDVWFYFTFDMYKTRPILKVKDAIGWYDTPTRYCIITKNITK